MPIEDVEFEFEDVLERASSDEPVEETTPAATTTEGSNGPVVEGSVTTVVEETNEETDEDIKPPVSKEEDEEQEETPDVKGEEESEEEDAAPSVVSEVLTKLGFEDFDASEYEDSVEGITKMTTDAGRKIAGETLDQLFNAFPTVQKHLEYLQTGGKPEDFARIFSPPKDYASIEIKEDDKESQKAVLTDYFKARGDDDAFISDMIESYEDKGKLYEKSTQAGGALAKAQENQRAQVMERQRAEAAQREQQAVEAWNGVKETITKADDLAGLPITAREKTAFIDYISKPVDQYGRTQRDIDFQTMDIQKQLAVDFLAFKKLDFGKFIGKKAKTVAAEDLRSRLKNTVKKPKASRHLESAPGSEAVEKLELDNLL